MRRPYGIYYFAQQARAALGKVIDRAELEEDNTVLVLATEALVKLDAIMRHTKAEITKGNLNEGTLVEDYAVTTKEG